MNRWRQSTFVFAVIALVLVVALAFAVPQLASAKQEAVCEATNRNQRLISELIDVFGGPEAIVDDRDARDRIVELLKPIDC